MQQALMTLPVVAAVLFWGIYHWHKDRDLPEPVGNLVLCFVLGILAAGLSKLMYMGLGPLGLRFDAGELALSNTLALLAYALLAIGPIEELAKMLPFLIVVLRFEAFDEPIDGIIYASFIALGYATVENFQYLAYLTPLEAAARAFASPVIHILFASIWAYSVTVARLRSRPIRIPVAVGFLRAALLHGTYDFLVLQQPVAALPAAAFMVVAIWVWRLRLLRRLRTDGTVRHQD